MTRPALAWLAWLAACGATHGAAGDAPAGTDATADAAGDAAIDGSIDAANSSACPTGSTLVVDRTSCGSSAPAPPSALASETAAPGDVVSLAGLDEGALPCLPVYVCAPGSAATLLFSDDPESPSADGVLYADTVGPGRARIYVYHVDASGSARAFPIVALNPGGSDAHVTIVKQAIGAPSTDYVDEGKSVAAAWLGSTTSAVVTIPAGTRVLLVDTGIATTNQLVHAIVDLDADAPVKFSVVSVLAGEDAATLTASLPLIAADGLHDRGTFAGADVVLAGSAGGDAPSARHVRLGANITEPDLAGHDATTGSAATLHGNYGVAYTFAIAALDPALRFAASARGGAWAGALGGSGSAIALPSAPGGLATTTDAIWLGAAARFVLLTGGGSSLPIDVVAIAP